MTMGAYDQARDHNLHASDGGLRDLYPDASAATYANHLARYVTCATTIRAHVMRNYDRGPSVEDIIAMQAKHQARRETYRRQSESLRLVSDGSGAAKRPEAIHGPEYQSRCNDQRIASAALLAAIKLERGL